VTELELCAGSARRDELDATARQRAKGKVTIRERLDKLVDVAPFQEVGAELSVGATPPGSALTRTARTPMA